MKQTEALKLALDALEKHGDAYLGHSDEYQFAITKVKEALESKRMAQPEQLKVSDAPCNKCGYNGAGYYQPDTHPCVAQPEQEPVAWMSEHRFDELRKGFTVMTTLTKQRAFEDDVALYTTLPQRTWVGLTDEEMNDLVHNHDDFDGLWEFTDAVETKLKEKNA